LDLQDTEAKKQTDPDHPCTGGQSNVVFSWICRIQKQEDKQSLETLALAVTSLSTNVVFSWVCRIQKQEDKQSLATLALAPHIRVVMLSFLGFAGYRSKRIDRAWQPLLWRSHH
jgi:hypothetical protein